MTPAGAVLVAAPDDEQEALRLWEGLEAATPPRALVRREDEVAPSVPEPLDLPAGPTLEDLVAGAWEGLVAGARAACPGCGGEMRARWSAGAGIVGGHCPACGTGVT